MRAESSPRRSGARGGLVGLDYIDKAGTFAPRRSAPQSRSTNRRRWPYRFLRKSNPLSSTSRQPGLSSAALRSVSRRNLPVDGATELGVADRGVEHDTGQFAEESRRLVDRVGRGVVELLEVTTRPGVRLGQATVEQVYRLIGDVRQRLVEEGHQGRIPAYPQASVAGPALWPAGRPGRAA